MAKKEREGPPPGWIAAKPLENYSSLNELSLFELMGIPIRGPRFFVQFCLNLHAPLTIHPEAYLTFHTRDSEQPPCDSPCFSISQINRFRLDIAAYSSMDDYLANLIRWHRCNYNKSKTKFNNYGCTITLLENDWSSYADKAFDLYRKVANRHGDWLYDRTFFHLVSKRPDYKLLAAWHQNEMIGMFLLQDEQPTIHSIACGMDYNHSSASYAYSWMHYDLIERAIGKYRQVDIGLTADDSKRMIGFQEIDSTMDIYSQGVVTNKVLKVVSKFVQATITPGAKLKFHFK